MYIKQLVSMLHRVKT